jgi:hypothetical protein
MAEALVLEFRDVSPDKYREVNGYLGIDPVTGEGDWPAGLIDHLGLSGDGDVVTVVEMWDSRASQQAFMEGRLGAALGKAGLPEPSRAEWLTVHGHHHLEH